MMDEIKISNSIIDKDLDEKCTVCLCPFKKDAMVWELKCKHVFHHDCLKTWLTEYNYPFRCHDKKGFEECYKQICELTIEEKRKYVVDFRDYLRKYDNKKRWAKQFIDLYNS